MPAKKIVYLFGAGATIAEATYAGIVEPLSLEHISGLVVEKARRRKVLKEILGHIQPDDIKDIELYISLLESLQIRKYTDMTNILRSLFCAIIQEKLLVDNAPLKPTLSMALLQMHKAIEDQEELKGAISLNYDSLLDHAFNEIHHGLNYGIKCKCSATTDDYVLEQDSVPLIKLHGSFNWKRSFPLITIDEQQAQSGEQSEMLWLPPSIEKERDMYPFNTLWGKAYEILDCDILRIVGCKLSQNDWGLISLLFNTQLRTDDAYQIELITSHDSGLAIRSRNGFLKNVKALGELEGCQLIVKYGTQNVFESWLKNKISMLRQNGLCIGEQYLDYVNEIMGVKM
jgi:hypothetical protein